MPADPEWRFSYPGMEMQDCLWLVGWLSKLLKIVEASCTVNRSNIHMAHQGIQMIENRALVIHFNDSTEISFIFPKQTDDSSVARKIREVLSSQQFVVEADGSLFVIPHTSIKYVQIYPSPDKLPDNVIKGATLRNEL